MADEIKELEFLASKSKEILEKQYLSYKNKQSSAATIIGLLGIFVPFFINGISDTMPLFYYLAIVPVILVIYSVVVLLLVIIKGKLFFQFFHVNKFDELVNKTYQDVLLFEIGANVASFKDNQPICEKISKHYTKCIIATALAIVLATGLLVANNFVKLKTPQKPIQVEIINQKVMSNSKPKKNPPPRVIPTVPPGDRGRLNEGPEKPSTIPPKPSKPK